MNRAKTKSADAAPSSALNRNDTGFPAKCAAKLFALHARYIQEREQALAADPQNPENWAGVLKYYQYLVRAVFSDPDYGIGAQGNGRGLLVAHGTGFGKTRLAVAVAMSMWDVRPPVVFLARGLQKNFAETVAAVVRALHAGEDAETLGKRVEQAVARFEFVSMDAYNAADQVMRVGTPARKKPKRGEPPPLFSLVGGLDNKLLVVDEAHNFFRAIINSSAENANARRVYDMVMAARNLRLVFLTGTPAAKNPFELVPCFNMLAGGDLLPTQYEVFTRLYVDKDKRRVRNRERLANRLVGLVSMVSHSRPSEVAVKAGQALPQPSQQKQPRDDGWFPEKKPLIVDRVEMAPDQYRRYLLAREKEENEGKRGEGRAPSDRPPPPLSLPGSEKKAMKTYYVHSRSLSTFCPPREWANVPVDQMPDDVFTEATSPKCALIAQRALAAKGPVLIYSQFVDASGLKPAARYLQRLGFEAWTPPPPAPKKGGDDAPKAFRRVEWSQTADINFWQNRLDVRREAQDTIDQPDEKIEQVFGRARAEGLLVSFASPRANYGMETIFPTMMPGIKPLDVLWISRPDRGNRSWYAVAKAQGMVWARPERMAIVGYKLAEDKLLRVGTPEAVAEFDAKYGVCPDGVDPKTCEIRSYIDWARVAMDHAGVAFDPYLVDAKTLKPDASFKAPFWYETLEAVTYVVWHSSAVKEVKVLYEPPKPETPTPEAPNPEAPKFETPKPETPNPEAPKLETPTPEAPKLEGPEPEGPKPDAEKKGGGERPRYAIISGEVDHIVREQIKDASNHPDNVRGGVIKAILVSKTGAEGLDLKFIRETHAVESYWDQARLDQVEARAVRIGALDALPREDRDVQAYVYLGVANQAMWQQIPADNRELKAIDEMFYERALTQYELNESFRGLLAEVSLECAVYGYGDCRVCVPTGAPLFHDDPELDMRLPDPCVVKTASTVKALPIELSGTTYYYSADPSTPLGYIFYGFRSDLGGYSRLEASDPAVTALLRALGAE